jgi:hypothetical protein
MHGSDAVESREMALLMFSRGSTDGGKTWQVEYDFTYTRKK